jgi:TonB family protein
MYKKLSFLLVALNILIFGAGLLRADNRKAVKTSPPVYPAIAAKMKIEGTVKLDATIDPDGTVSDVKVLSGHQLLAGAAVDAVKKWKYEPAEAKSTQSVTVDFALAH